MAQCQIKQSRAGGSQFFQTILDLVETIILMLSMEVTHKIYKVGFKLILVITTLDRIIIILMEEALKIVEAEISTTMEGIYASCVARLVIWLLVVSTSLITILFLDLTLNNITHLPLHNNNNNHLNQINK